MLTYTEVTSLSWANAEHTAINCWVKFDAFEELLPFTATPDDCEAHCREIFHRAVNAEFGYINEFAE